MERKEKYNVAIAGATGAVGQEMMEILEGRNFPVGNCTFSLLSAPEGENTVSAEEK